MRSPFLFLVALLISAVVARPESHASEEEKVSEVPMPSFDEPEVPFDHYEVTTSTHTCAHTVTYE
jgi:hypothetical protein